MDIQSVPGLTINRIVADFDSETLRHHRASQSVYGRNPLRCFDSWPKTPTVLSQKMS